MRGSLAPRPANADVGRRSRNGVTRAPRPARSSVIARANRRPDQHDRHDAAAVAAVAARSAPSSSSPSPPPPTTATRRLVLSAAAAAAAASALPPLAPTPAAQARTAPGDWSSPGLASRPEDDDGAPAFTKTPSGARLQVVDGGARGDPIDAPPLGPDGAVAPGDRVELDYSLRRQNGYFIYSTVEGVSFQPRDVPTGVVELTMGGGAGGVGGAGGPGSAPAVIRGLEEALVGLRAGARFRVLVPPGIGFTDGGAGALGPLPPTFATKRQLLNHVREPLLFEVEVLKVKKRK